MARAPILDPYLAGYAAGRAAARRHGPVPKATIEKLTSIAAELARVLGREAERPN